MSLLSIVLPCYNEARGLAALVQRYAEVKGDTDFELILINNGSKDNTEEVMANLRSRFPFVRTHTVIQNKGYGDGIWQGLQIARGEWIGWSHADLQTDPADVFRAHALLKQQPAPEQILVKGSRVGRALSEQIITWGMQAVASVLLRGAFHEINAQPKMFHRRLLPQIKAPPIDFNFDIYVLYQAKRAGWTFRSIPVQFPPRQYGYSNWSKTWGSKIRTIRRSISFMARLGLGNIT